MKTESSIDENNQTTIPAEIVAILMLKPGSVLNYETIEDGRIALSSKSATFEGLAATFPVKSGTIVRSLDDMQDAIRTSAVDRHC